MLKEYSELQYIKTWDVLSLSTNFPKKHFPQQTNTVTDIGKNLLVSSCLHHRMKTNKRKQILKALLVRLSFILMLQLVYYFVS